MVNRELHLEMAESLNTETLQAMVEDAVQRVESSNDPNYWKKQAGKVAAWIEVLISRGPDAL